jgi:hypothetical protein
VLIALTQFAVVLMAFTQSIVVLRDLKQFSRTFFRVHFKVTQVLNMAPLKTTNYGMLLKKLKKELVESNLVPINKKTKKDQQTYYSIDNQSGLLDVCGYKGYILCPPLSNLPWKQTSLWITML